MESVINDWGGVAPDKRGHGKPMYLWLKSGNKYRIRPLLLPIEFYKYFNRKDGRARFAICDDPATCPVAAKHTELQKPSSRYAIYVIDRSDQQVKIMEAPRSVFSPMRQRYETNGKKPGGGADGSDWRFRL